MSTEEQKKKLEEEVEKTADAFARSAILGTTAAATAASALVAEDEATRRNLLDAAKTEAVAAAAKVGEGVVAAGGSVVAASSVVSSNISQFASSARDRIVQLFTPKSITGMYNAGKDVKKGNSVYLVWNEDVQTAMDTLGLIKGVDYLELPNVTIVDVNLEVEKISRIINARQAAQSLTAAYVQQWFNAASQVVRNDSLSASVRRNFDNSMGPFVRCFNIIVGMACPDGSLGIDEQSCVADQLFDNIPMNRRAKVLNFLRLQMLSSLKLIDVAADAVAAMQRLVF